MYCQHCGNQVEDQAEAEAQAAEEMAGAETDVAETVSTAEVEIARIQADRDITLAKIERGIAGEAIEAAAEVATTEDAVKADILDAAMEPAEPAPVQVIAEGPADDGGPAEEPPPVVDAEPEPVGRKNSNPWW